MKLILDISYVSNVDLQWSTLTTSSFWEIYEEILSQCPAVHDIAICPGITWTHWCSRQANVKEELKVGRSGAERLATCKIKCHLVLSVGNTHNSPLPMDTVSCCTQLRGEQRTSDEHDSELSKPIWWESPAQEGWDMAPNALGGAGRLPCSLEEQHGCWPGSLPYWDAFCFPNTGVFEVCSIGSSHSWWLVPFPTHV